MVRSSGRRPGRCDEAHNASRRIGDNLTCQRATIAAQRGKTMNERTFTDTSSERLAVMKSELRGPGYMLVAKDIGQKAGPMENTKTLAW